MSAREAAPTQEFSDHVDVGPGPTSTTVLSGRIGSGSAMPSALAVNELSACGMQNTEPLVSARVPVLQRSDAGMVTDDEHTPHTTKPMPLDEPEFLILLSGLDDITKGDTGRGGGGTVVRKGADTGGGAAPKTAARAFAAIAESLFLRFETNHTGGPRHAGIPNDTGGMPHSGPARDTAVGQEDDAEVGPIPEDETEWGPGFKLLQRGHVAEATDALAAVRDRCADNNSKKSIIVYNTILNIRLISG